MASTPKIVKAQDTVSGSLKMLLYGNSGVGKTTFAATAPKPIYLSAEAGLLSVADRDVDAVEIGGWEELHGAFDWLKNGRHEYLTVIVDSLTELQKKHQDHLLSKTGKPRLTQQDWGDNIEALRKACRAFRDLPLNVILIALANETSSEDGGAPLVRPALQGRALPNEVMGYTDLVGYMVASERKDEQGKVTIARAIRFQPTETIAAKDRSGKLDIWEKPDFAAIYNKIFDTPKAVKKEVSA